MSASTSSVGSAFTGTSQFSQDLQNVITRAVSIASLPLTQMQSDQTTYNNQATALTGLDTQFTALQSAIAGVNGAMGGSSFETDVSNTDAVSVSVGDGAQEGEYSIDVQNPGAYATSLSSATWNDPATPQTYKVYVGTAEYDITPADNSAQTVAAAINAAAGGAVQATVVNVGSPDTPDYRIAMQGQALGDLPVDIQLNGASLQTQQTRGELAQYEVNGSGVTATSSSSSVQISGGLTVTMLASDDGTPVNITLTRSTSALSDALTTFASAYNSAVSAVTAQRGSSGGALAGQSIVYELGQTLSQLGTYSSPGSAVPDLTAIGLELQKDGTITYDPSTLMAAELSNPAALSAFLGSATGGGFLQAATNALNGVETADTGTLKSAETATQQQVTDIGAQIGTEQGRINQLQTQLTAQMTAADAAISTMEQQYNYLNGLFSAMQTADQQFSGE
jgi:flagellar hook-associated protein 2